jgi:hypothetical protein
MHFRVSPSSILKEEHLLFFFVYKATDDSTKKEKHFKELWKETEATLDGIIFLGICSLPTNFCVDLFLKV